MFKEKLQITYCYTNYLFICAKKVLLQNLKDERMANINFIASV